MVDDRIEPLERMPRVWVRAWIARTLVILAVVSALVAIGGFNAPTPFEHFIAFTAACAALGFAGLRRMVNGEPFCALCGVERKHVVGQMVMGRYGAICASCVTESLKIVGRDLKK